jgi:SpoVK/Ycf46/Vps4 family AAA+-type ATPase
LQISKIYTQTIPLADDVDTARLSKMTEGYTGADIASFASAAAMVYMKEHLAKYKQDTAEPKENRTIY